MSSLLNSWHDVIAWLTAALCFVGIVHPRLPTGVMATAGLGAIMVGVLYSLDELHDPMMALDIVIGGVALIGICLAIRVIRRPHRSQMRRVEDWFPSALETLPPDLRAAVRGGNKTPPPMP